MPTASRSIAYRVQFMRTQALFLRVSDAYLAGDSALAEQLDARLTRESDKLAAMLSTGE